MKKSGRNLTDMSNQREVHVLQLFRQLYVRLLLPKLDELSRLVVPDCQQRFIRSGFIGSSHLTLHALIERARLQIKRLFAAFVGGEQVHLFTELFCCISFTTQAPLTPCCGRWLLRTK